jgi:hypothetical protein
VEEGAEVKTVEFYRDWLVLKVEQVTLEMQDKTMNLQRSAKVNFLIVRDQRQSHHNHQVVEIGEVKLKPVIFAYKEDG